MKRSLLFVFSIACLSCRKPHDQPPVVVPPVDTSTMQPPPSDTTPVTPPVDTVVLPPAVNDTAVEYTVAPVQTDPLIDVALESHFISVKEKSALKNVLFVFLPGSYAKPAQYKAIVRKAASLGYHSIGLMYPDDKPVNNFCANTNDTTCHRRARLEIVDGIDRSPNISVNNANSIINRLQKLLIYLRQHYAAEGWGQFMAGDSAVWTKIIVSGHSQGGGNAAVLGRYYPVKKVIMFSMMDFMNNGKVPDWENMTFNKGRYYDIFNPLDEAVPYSNAVLGWEHMVMTSSSHPAVESDAAGLPYDHAHVLLTSKTPARMDGPKFHNSTVMDAYVEKDTNGNYVLDKQWEYLITE